MVAAMLLMFAGGIGLTQACSDPRQVTLRWLRLGGIIAVTLLAVAMVVDATSRSSVNVGVLGLFGMVAVPMIAQLLAVQQAHRRTQRIAAWAAFLMAVILAWSLVMAAVKTASPSAAGGTRLGPVDAAQLLTLVTTALSAGLLGGFLMAMLLGHAYLTAADEMTQRPFRRLVVVLGALLLLRAVISVQFGLLPYWQEPTQDPIEAITGAGAPHRLWTNMMVLTRYFVGIAVPMLLTYMTWDCVRRRSNQSATGILYVAGMLIILGEGTSLALFSATGRPF